jgi:hypothetical protein
MDDRHMSQRLFVIFGVTAIAMGSNVGGAPVQIRSSRDGSVFCHPCHFAALVGLLAAVLPAATSCVNGSMLSRARHSAHKDPSRGAGLEPHAACQSNGRMNASEALACVMPPPSGTGNLLGVGENPIHRRYADRGAPGDLGAL